jgi:transposase-like protein
MLKSIKKVEPKPSLIVMMHDQIRVAIERAVEEELAAALGAPRYVRTEERRGHRNGARTRTLTGPTGPFEMRVPRGTIVEKGHAKEWRSTILPRYQRRIVEVNGAITAAYLCGANTRKIRGALSPLLRDAPLSKSAVSRVIVTLKSAFDAWRKRSLANLDVVYMYLDGIALKIRSAKKVVSMPVLATVAVLKSGEKQLVSLEVCASESHDAWKGHLDDLIARGLKKPLLAVIDGGAGLRSALREAWSDVPVQRCTVHKLRNIARKAPKHAYDEIKSDYHRIVYAEDLATAERERQAFGRKWSKTCPGVVESLEEAGDELLTFFGFPKAQWKTLRTTNVIERLNGEFRRRVKTQCSLCTEDAAVVVLYSLVACGHIRLRKLDGYERIVNVVGGQQRAA